MQLNLIVLRSDDMESLAGFYSALLGKELKRHRHGKGPEHFGTELEGLVFEIYPKRNDRDDTTSFRFGFVTESLDLVLKRIDGFETNVVSEPKSSPWGRRMVLDDPEGHRIELTEPLSLST